MTSVRSFSSLAAIIAIGLLAQLAAGSVTVNDGDTLYAISRRTGVSVSDLIQLNGLTNPDHIEAGDRLALGNGPRSAATVVVRPGDTLFAISRRTGVPVAKLIALNALSNPDHVRDGVILALPTRAGGGVAPAPAATPAPTPAPPSPVAAPPPGSRPHVTTLYAVRTGDTLSGIARRFAIPVPELQELNDLTSGQGLSVGQYLLITP